MDDTARVTQVENAGFRFDKACEVSEMSLNIFR